MASTSSPATVDGSWVVAVYRDVRKLTEKREEMGDEGKFRRMCDSETSIHGYNVLHLAVGNGVSDVCHFLVDEVGVDINAKTYRGSSPLSLAVKMEHFDIAKYLIDSGADVDFTDPKGLTPLHSCIRKGNTEFMTFLLSRGADIQADSVVGKPLDFAARSGSAGMVNFLLQNKAEPNSSFKYHHGTPLVSALHSKINTFECVQLLLKAKADPNMTSDGLSPLAHAVGARSNSCINALLAAGADVDSVSSRGLTLIEHAVLVCNVEAIWMLIRARPRILSSPDWSFLALMKSINTALDRKLELSKTLKQKGDAAWDRQDYSSAVALYNQAMYHNTNDLKITANRSLCWSRLGEGMFALNDAEKCVKQRPDWPKAHLIEAMAWHVLKRYRMSSDAFKRYYEMDQANKEIEREEVN